MHGLTYKIWCQDDSGAQQSKTCKTPCAPAISGSPARMSGRLTIIETAASNRDESRLQCTNLDNNRRQNLESDESLSDTDVSRIPFRGNPG